MARKLLWQMGLSGSPERIRIREAVCLLIRYHSYPPFCIGDKDDVKLHRIAANGELTDAFSLRRLIALERADVLGRIGEGREDMLEKVNLCEMMAAELKILDTPYRFSSDYTKRAYMRRRLHWRGGDLYKPCPFEVVLMAGLPGTGKDTYIERHFPTLHIISLDGIRERLGISATENQGKVIEAAHSEARALLRKKTPFVWNATSITAEIRSMQISLFEEYGASVRCIYLETEWEENLRRNRERERTVPEKVIERMLERLEIPEAYECESVVWETV
jgi:predicted kinase